MSVYFKILKETKTPIDPDEISEEILLQNNVAKLFLTERIAFNYFQHCKWGEGDALTDRILCSTPKLKKNMKS